MQRLFGDIKNNLVYLSNDDLHHLLNVKRYKVGEKLEVVSDNETYLCELISINPVRIEVLNKINFNRENKANIGLAFCLLKGDHNSLIVEKCTEIGISTFYPLISDRCVIKVDLKDDSNRTERLKKIAKNASEQSRREIIPSVSNTLSFKDAISLPYKNKVIAYEGIAGSSKTLLNFLIDNKNISDLLILIGPEGGFSDEEIKLYKENNFTFVSLGKTILRGETACICAANLACSVLGEHNE